MWKKETIKIIKIKCDSVTECKHSKVWFYSIISCKSSSEWNLVWFCLCSHWFTLVHAGSGLPSLLAPRRDRVADLFWERVISANRTGSGSKKSETIWWIFKINHFKWKHQHKQKEFQHTWTTCRILLQHSSCKAFLRSANWKTALKLFKLPICVLTFHLFFWLWTQLSSSDTPSEEIDVRK